MRHLRDSAAFIYGFLLVYFVYIWLGGFMAARQVPKEYFELFSSHGATARELALALVSLTLHFIPTVCLLVIGTLLPAWLSRTACRQVGVSVLLGSVFSYLFWTYFYSLESQGGTGLLQELAVYTRTPWWGVPAMLAPLVGFLAAYVLLSRVSPRRAGA